MGMHDLLPPQVRLKLTTSLFWVVAILVLLTAMLLDTHVVRIGSAENVQEQVFSPAAFANTQFPIIQTDIVNRAVDINVLYKAIAADKKVAGEKYGVASGIGPVIPVFFTGIIKEGKSGIFKISIQGFPEKPLIRVQTGPAVNGTDIRDATGDIEFGQFKNQIEYQNVGSALNNVVKTQVLASIDHKNLMGKVVKVVGVFKLINPKSWLITPVKFEVQ
jgi:predicted lipoprotein